MNWKCFFGRCWEDFVNSEAGFYIFLVILSLPPAIGIYAIYELLPETYGLILFFASLGSIVLFGLFVIVRGLIRAIIVGVRNVKRNARMCRRR